MGLLHWSLTRMHERRRTVIDYKVVLWKTNEFGSFTPEVRETVTSLTPEAAEVKIASRYSLRKSQLPHQYTHDAHPGVIFRFTVEKVTK